MYDIYLMDNFLTTEPPEEKRQLPCTVSDITVYKYLLNIVDSQENFIFILSHLHDSIH